MLGGSGLGAFGRLQTRRSPSTVCVASISVFCLDEDPCQASPVILDGALVVVKVCSIVNDGRSVAINIDPFMYLPQLAPRILVKSSPTYPIANVRQSAEGASAVIGSYIVRAAMCSDVEGSNRMILP